MKLNRLHAATMAPSPSHVRTREEKGADVRAHQRARRSNSDDNGRSKSALAENRITTIPEITESFERRLCLRNKKAASAVSVRAEAEPEPEPPHEPLSGRYQAQFVAAALIGPLEGLRSSKDFLLTRPQIQRYKYLAFSSTWWKRPEELFLMCVCCSSVFMERCCSLESFPQNPSRLCFPAVLFFYFLS